MREGNRREDIAQAAALLAERRAGLADAQADLTRLRTLSGTGAIAERRLEDATHLRDEAAARQRAAEQAYAAQRAGARRQELRQAESNVDRAQSGADRIGLRLRDTVLRAPSDGTILTRAVEKGANVAAGSTAFTEALASPVTNAIVFDKLVKRFGARAETVAIDGLSTGIKAGTITGLVGPDGAGKTTLLRMVTGLLAPTGGTVRCRPWMIASLRRRHPLSSTR